jgi:hypothetical protein
MKTSSPNAWHSRNSGRSIATASATLTKRIKPDRVNSRIFSPKLGLLRFEQSRGAG